MGAYPGSERERRVSASALNSHVTAIYRACGMSQPDATLLAHTLVLADLRGMHSHGVMRVPEYVKKLAGGGVNPKGTAAHRAGQRRSAGGGRRQQHGADRVEPSRCDMPSSAPGLVTSPSLRFAAAITAVPWTTSRCSRCRTSMIGIAATNALPTMAPWGGLAIRFVGLNPLAVAIPAGSVPADRASISRLAPPPTARCVFTSRRAYRFPRVGRSTVDGRPTTDVDEALAGFIQPIGAYKGIGLGIVVGILSTLLSGASYGTELGNMVDGAKPGADGQFFMALDIAAFAEAAKFKAGVDRIVEQLHASPLAQGAEAVYAPGEREWLSQQRYRAEGVPLNEGTLAGLAEAALKLGISPME